MCVWRSGRYISESSERSKVLAKSKKLVAVAALATALLPAISAYQPAPASAADFADAAFQRVWTRTDKPVADKTAVRSWYWGPTPGETKTEAYAQGAGGTRKVQYFDKSRMEINNPDGDKNSQFYVTNGLLTVELVSGKMQVGNSSFEGRFPAHIPLASDNDDKNAPTYATFTQLANTYLGNHYATDQTGKAVNNNINRAGITSRDTSKEKYGVKYAHYDTTTQHNIADKFWDFVNLSGQVVGDDGKLTTAKLSDPWFYTTGLPISEAYWANVKIAGKQEDVMIQLFERRVLTYVPSYAPEWRVQMGNIGAHYYDWRYKGAGKQFIAHPDVKPITVAAGQVGSSSNPLRMVFTPSVNSTKIAGSGKGLADQLSKITGYTITVPPSPATSYAAVIESMGSNNVDIAWLAPFAYALAHQKFGAEAIASAVRYGSITYPSVFITADPNIKTIADFKGKKFAFVDPTSASGYLYPVAAFKNAGLITGSTPNLEGFFGSGNVLIAGGHDKVVSAVYNGQVAGGAVFGGPLSASTGNPTDARSLLAATYPDVYTKVRIIYESQQIPNDNVSVRKGLDPAMTKQIQQGLLELAGTDQGVKLIGDLYGITDLAPVTDSFYDPLRQVAEDAGISDFGSLFPTPVPKP